MEMKTEIKKANFYDTDFVLGKDFKPFLESVSGALALNRKNDYAEKLKSLLLEKSGENKAFLFNSVEESYLWLFKSIRANETSQNQKKEIIFLSRDLYNFATTELYVSDENLKYVFANHLGNFIASLTDKTCAVVIELLSQNNEPIYEKDFLRQISEICSVRDVALIIDERRTSFGVTGSFFAFQNYGILPDAVICGGNIYRSFSLGAVLTGKRIKAVQNKKEMGLAVCSGTLALAEGVDGVKSSVKRRGKELSDALNICKRVKTCKIIGLKGYAETSDGKKLAAELKEKGLKVGVSENKLIFSVPLLISDDEFAFGVSVIKEVLLGAQNPFDTDKID